MRPRGREPLALGAQRNELDLTGGRVLCTEPRPFLRGGKEAGLENRRTVAVAHPYRCTGKTQRIDHRRIAEYLGDARIGALYVLEPA